MSIVRDTALSLCAKTTNPQACADEINALNLDSMSPATAIAKAGAVLAKYSVPDFSLPDIAVTTTTPGQGSTPPVYTPPIIPPSQSSGSFLTSTAGMVAAGVAVVGLGGLLVWKRRQNSRRAMPMSGLRRNKKGQFVKGRRGRKSVRGLGCTCTC